MKRKKIGKIVLTAENPQWFEKDGVHPGNDGAAAMAAEIGAYITANP